MSTTTETNGTTTNRVRNAMAATKFGRMYGLLGKGADRKFSLKRSTDEGSVTLRLDGFPASLDAKGASRLAEENGGGKASASAPIGAAEAGYKEVVPASVAVSLIREMTEE